MFKKLRVKFIAITMVMVGLVMALSFSAVCVIEYQRSYSVVQTALSDAVGQAEQHEMVHRFRDGFAEAPSSQDESRSASAADVVSGNVAESAQRRDLEQADSLSSDQDPFDGTAPTSWRQDGGAFGGTRGPFAPTGGEGITINDENAQEAAPPSIGTVDGQSRGTSSLIPVAVYRVSPAGEMTLVPEVTSASISNELLEQAAEAALLAEGEYGTFAEWGLHYYKTTDEDVTYLAFADTSYTDGWKSLAVMLALVGAGTLIVFFFVALLYSRWALRPVKQAWESQKRFVADASHDLKTPLTVILANASILLKHPERTIASESQWVESTQKEAEEMQGLINEMLELAQVEDAQAVSPVRDPIDLSDLVDGETLLFDSVALERGCVFECDVEGGIEVAGDEKQMRKLVSTLVENAFKYVDDAGEVEIALQRAGKMAKLSVRNTGTVISPEDLPHIFERFYRTDKARTSGAGGFGLGLAIAHEIAVQHGGQLTCDSAPGTGTMFTVTVPLS